MRNINNLTEEEQIDILNSEYYYYCSLNNYDYIGDLELEENAFIVGEYCISKYPIKNVRSVKDEVYPIFIIQNISNISENVELAAVRSMYQYKTRSAVCDRDFKVKYLEFLLKHEKSKELYNKLKAAHSIIK